MTSTLSSTTATAVVATVEALTTVFVAPSTCYSMQLTMLSSPGWRIWLNEPQPVPGTLYPNCYPSQFIDGYSSVFNQSSSIAPMMSPLVAPENWVTAQERDDGYVALCPSGFQVQLPDTPIDSNRPAYGGTCWSAFEAGKTVLVSGFNSVEYTGTVTFVPTAGDQAYAHIIEGKKATSTAPNTATATDTGATGITTTAPTGVSQTTSGAAAPTSSTDSGGSKGISGGAIAGAVVGSVVGVALIVAVIFFLLRRRHSKDTSGQGVNQYSPEMASAGGYQGADGGYQGADSAYQANNTHHNGDKAFTSVPQTTSPDSAYSQAPPTYQNLQELPAHHAVEMESPQGPHSNYMELDTGYQGNELQNGVQNHGYSHH